MRATIDNLEYLAALLHGRRNTMAEGARLLALCQVRSLPEFTLQVSGQAAQSDPSALQRWLVERLATEAIELAEQLSGAAAGLLCWLAERVTVENLKLVIRRLTTGGSLESLRSLLVPLPRSSALDLPDLVEATSVQELIERMPVGPFQREMVKAHDRCRTQTRSFFFEAALDRAYSGELLARLATLPEDDSTLVRPSLVQEVDTFHLTLVTRGKLFHHLTPDLLLPLHLPGTRIPRGLLSTMLGSADLDTIASLSVGRVLDTLPSTLHRPGTSLAGLDAGWLERLAWSRTWRLANWEFRCSAMGLPTLFAYLTLRRMETANLITLSEGIRLGVPAEALRQRLIPLPEVEALNV